MDDPHLRDSNRQLAGGLKACVPALSTTIVFSFFVNLLAFVSPIYMLQIYDRVITSRNETTLLVIAGLAGYLLLVHASLEMLRSRIMMRAGMMFDEKLANSVFDAVHRANMQRPGGGYVQSLRDIDVIRDFISGSGLIALCDAPWTPLFVAASFMLHPFFGWIAVIGATLILLLTLASELTTTQILKLASRASAAMMQKATATFRNGEVLQAMGMLAALRGQWSSQRSNVLRLQAIAGGRSGLISAASKFVRMFLQTIVLGIGAYLAIHREISPGAIIAASIIIGRALAPIEGIVGNWKAMTATRNSYQRLARLLSVAGEEKPLMAMSAPRGYLQLENVVAGAPGQSRASLRGISFAASPGDVVGILGPSAAGKSSLARVITGVWPRASGVVRLDGADIMHWDSQELGRYIGYLPQDVELFAGTVAQNIARFQEIDAEAVTEIAMLAGCHDMVQHMPEGYNTQIGEGGEALSGGQRQRIGLARAFYGRPAIVVLDEPNASLDTTGEESLLAAIKRFSSFGSTIVVITHKTNILAAVDKILILKEGLVEAFGDRDEVLARLGLRRTAVAKAG